MKQTAVEWFYQRILAKDIKEVFEKAKQMEKEQMLEVSKEGIFSTHEFEQYYKETFNTKEK